MHLPFLTLFRKLRESNIKPERCPRSSELFVNKSWIHLHSRTRVVPGPACREDLLNRAGHCREHQSHSGWPGPGHLEQPHVQNRIIFQVTADCSRPSPAEFGNSPSMEIPQPLWVIWSSAEPLSWWNLFFLYVKSELPLFQLVMPHFLYCTSERSLAAFPQPPC